MATRVFIAESYAISEYGFLIESGKRPRRSSLSGHFRSYDLRSGLFPLFKTFKSMGCEITQVYLLWPSVELSRDRSKICDK